MDVSFTAERPEPDATYSTLYLGGDGSEFLEYGTFWGISEKVDHGNADPTDSAFVFTDAIVSTATTAAGYAREIAGFVAHEVGHLLGFEHAHADSDGSSGRSARSAFASRRTSRPRTTCAPTSSTTGSSRSTATQYDVHPKIVEAMRLFPSSITPARSRATASPTW